NRDALVTAPTTRELLARLAAIASGQLVLPASRHFDPVRARQILAAQLERDPARCIVRLAYRPCEERALCVVAPLCHRPRPRLLQAVAQSELCLQSARKERGLAAWNLFAAARLPADSSFLSTRSSCRTRVFPSHD